MKLVMFSIVSLFVGLTSWSQPKSLLSGRITEDGTGIPLVGATIRIHDINRDAVADAQGDYRTSSLPAGKYLVEVSYIGHQTIVEMVDINGATEKNFSLKDAVVEQEGVTVTGVSAATRLKQSPQPVAILKKAELMKISSSNIINSLTQIPGVNAVTTGPAISKPFIRGLGYNRVVVVNDGIRQEGQQWGDEHGIEIDDYSAQRVEVLKGPASLMYGSDALAGVINIQSLMPAPEGTIRANLLGEYQTNSMLRGTYADLSGTKNGFSFNAYGSYKGAADYKNKYDGNVFNSKFYNKNFGGMLGYSGSWGHSFIRSSNFDQHTGMVEGERDAATGAFLKPVAGGTEEMATGDDFDKIKPFVPFQHIQHFKINTDNSFNIGRSKLDVLAGYQRNQRREFGDPDSPGEPEAYFDLKTVNYSTKLTLPFKGFWRTSIGISGMNQTNTNRAEEALIPDYRLFDIGGFVFTQYHKDKLSFSGGLRMDRRQVDGKQMMDGADVKFAAFEKSFSNISGSAGLTYEPSKDLSLKLNVARGFRAPTLAELSSNGAHEGTNRYETGNPDLKSETSFQVDAGVEINSEHISLGAGLFYNHISNFIYYERVLNQAGADSIIVDPDSGDDLHVFRFDQQTANLYGVEFNMDIHPHPLDWLHFENTFSYTRAQFTQAIDGSKYVPNIPAARLLSQLKGNFLPKGESVRNVYVSLESDYTFRQDRAFTGYNTETATGGYWLVGVSVGADFVKKGKTLFSLNLSGMNLGDVAYQNHLSRLKYTVVNNVTGRQGVYNVGRNFGMKLSVPLEFKW
ncbi:TonB-dependent receptor [Terrimonas sp. NA20]|uniref:TonB-dependent receptor n=1 Tax=Terrimonas ginsenosidimutans TaxID=2908004 RepID=A0ABS9KW08_9BACT|nr:TonB-dependent receptor [Terrimonas ginsenosidimutans]MCG2616442.1 TonB-dependent receptor [Terrimonas ginsenosidimutans]